jgi:hypothetical protein
MARTRLMHDQRSRSNDIAFWIVFVLSFLFVFSIALFGTLTGMRWRRCCPVQKAARHFLAVFGLPFIRSCLICFRISQATSR